MPYDINNIRKTTDDGIIDLVNDIVAVPLSLDYVFSEIKFRPLRNKISQTLKDKDDSDWEKCSAIGEYRSYIEHYDRESPYYRGKHIEEAKAKVNIAEIIAPIDIDTTADKGPVEAETIDVPIAETNKESTASPEQIGNIMALIYRGALRKQVASDDNRDWLTATSENTIASYHRYIKKYSGSYGYVGKHIADASHRIDSLVDDSDWQKAIKTDTNQGYREYITKYSSIVSKWQGKYLGKAKELISKNSKRKQFLKPIAVAVVCVFCAIFIWNFLAKEPERIPLTNDEIYTICTEYRDSLKRELFDGFYLEPTDKTELEKPHQTSTYYSRQELISELDSEYVTFCVVNSEGKRMPLPEAAHGVDSICLKKAPFLEYIDNNGLRRVVALFKDNIYYYLGECGTHDGFPQFILVNEDGKFGLVDVNGTVLKEFVNEKIGLSSSPEGYYVKNGSTTQKYNFLGNAIDAHSPKPSSTTISSNELKIERHSGKAKDYFKDNAGRIVASFDEISYLSNDGLYKVEVNGMCGIYDATKRQMVLPINYEDVSVYGKATDLFPSKKNGKWGYVQTGGNTKIGFNFKEAQSFSASTKLAVVKNEEGKCGYIDINGNYKIQPQYYSAGTMTQDGARVMKTNDQYGFINSSGDLIASWYPFMGPKFILDRISVGSKDDKRGFVNRHNKLVIPYIFDKGKYDYSFDEKTHLCKVLYNGIEWYINTNGAFAYPVNGSPTEQNIAQQIHDHKAEAERHKIEKEDKDNKNSIGSERKGKTQYSNK